MPIDISPGSFAAVTIAVLFWWTLSAPAALLAIAVLCGRRPRLGDALTFVVLVQPLTLLPVAVMRGGLAAAAAAAAALLMGGALVLTGASLLRLQSDPARATRYATAALPTGVAGGVIGSIALILARFFV